MVGTMAKIDDSVKKKVPELRFAGFADDWEERKLGDEVTFFSGLTYSPDNIVESGSTLVLRSSNVQNGEIVDADNVYVENEAVNSDNVQVGDVIVVVRNGSRNLIGKHAQIKKEMDDTVIGAFMTGVRSDTPYFINALLDTEQFTREIYKNLGATINQITTGAFKKMQFVVPKNKTEKEQIGSFFKQLDDTIALHQRKLDLLKEQKKGFLQKMFPKNGAKVPELRFAGFADDWEQRKLGEVADIVTGKLDANAMKEDGEYDFYTSGIQKYKIDVPAFEGPAITIAGNGATVGYMHLADGKFNAYQRTYVLSAFQANRKFLFYEIGNKLPQKIAQEARTGNIPYIVMDMLTDLQIFIPPEHEQSKIGEYFSNLDHLITLHQRKLDLLKEQKKGFLQKMFV